MNPEPLVSVIMPAYNSSRFIRESVLSVLNQTYKNFELLIVDDSSSDETLTIIKEIENSDKRVKGFSIPHAGRPSVPRNFAIKKSSGELIAFIDSDDLWVPDKLETQVEFFQERKNPVFIYSISVTFGEVNIFSPQFEVLPLPYKAAKKREDLLKTGNTIPLSSVLADAGKLKRVNGFDEDPELKIEDYDLWIRLSELGDFYFMPRFHVKYRIHKSQFSADRETKIKRLDYLAKKRGFSLPPYKFYRRKGLLLIIRNTIHLAVYLWIRIFK